MKRIFEFIPTEHDIIVSRTLVTVHRAIDSHFPNATPASGKFAKTAFGTEEKTVTKNLPSDKINESEDSVSRVKRDGARETILTRSASEQKLWKQSLIAILTIAICAMTAYLLISLKVN